MEKFGKSSDAVLKHKNTFFQENNRLRSKLMATNEFYATQPQRKHCKNCNYKISGRSTCQFQKLGVDYLLCENCGHLNGCYEDTDEFCNFIYTDNSGQEYAENYKVDEIEEYFQRAQDIYEPKATFLLDGLKEVGEDSHNLIYADYGAGSGYFVSACISLGLERVIGYEVSEAQVHFGNKILARQVLQHINIRDMASIAEHEKADVVSMIGVLEHLQNPREILKSFNDNSNIKYLYISVPTFSLSVFFELMFPQIMPRQLAGAHTHLYTKKSIEWMENEFKLVPIARWWFGTDMVDLYRSVLVTMENNPDVASLSPHWTSQFEPVIDKLQLELDKEYLSSEVHVIYKLEH